MTTSDFLKSRTDSWNVITGSHSPRAGRSSNSRILSWSDEWLMTYDSIDDHSEVVGAFRWVLPALGVRISKWVPRDHRTWNRENHYVDIVYVGTVGPVWECIDLFLDFLVFDKSEAELIDIDEYVDAVNRGLIDRDLAIHALQAANRFANRLAVANFSTEALLNEEGAPLAPHL